MDKHLGLLGLLFCIVGILPVRGQDTYTPKEEEFLQQLEQAVSKRQRADVLSKMSESFIENHADTAKILAEELLNLTRGQKGKRAESYLKLGQAEYYLDEYQAAIAHFQDAKQYADDENKENNTLLANIHYYIGAAENYLGNYIQAKRAEENALEFVTKTKDDELKSYILYELAYSEYSIGEYESGIEHNLEAYEIDKERNDSTAINSVLNQLASAYNVKNQTDDALIYFKEAKNYISKSDPFAFEKEVSYHTNMGNVFMKKFSETKNQTYFESAETHFTKGLSIAQKKDFKDGEIALLLNFSSLEIFNEDFFLSRQYIEDAKKLIEETNLNQYKQQLLVYEADLDILDNKYLAGLKTLDELLDTTYFNLDPELRTKTLEKKAEVLFKMGRNKEAFQSMKQAMFSNKDLYNNTSAAEQEKFRTIYEMDQREAEIEKLELQNQIERRNKQLAQRMLFAFGLLGIGFILFIRYTSLQRRKIKELEYERELTLKENQIEGLQGRVAELIETKPEAPSIKENEGLPDLNDINNYLLTHLTEREYEVLKSIEEGLSNKEIAETHYISVNTVKYHLRNIYTKLDVSNRVQVIQRLRNIG